MSLQWDIKIGPSCGTQTYDCTPPCVNRKRIKILLCGI